MNRVFHSLELGPRWPAQAARGKTGALRPLGWLWLASTLVVWCALAGCSDQAAGDASDTRQSGRSARGGARGGPGGPPGFGGAEATALPVEVVPVERRAIADFLETNGSLEAENEVDIVTRTSGPIVELNVEEGQFVEAGTVLARIDSREFEAQLEVARVSLEEARLALERAKKSVDYEVISQEEFDQAQSRYEGAAAQIRSNELQLGYTTIQAPFSGLIIERTVKFAEHVANNQKLFRISDFTPLLCPIQVPEKDLQRLRVSQRAVVEVEGFPQRRFSARVLRVSPVIDGETGTIKVTLSVNGEGVLRPGMFASVFLETDVREGALVVPKRALVLEGIGDAVYVLADSVAERREVTVGYQEEDSIEIVSGVAEGDLVIVTGQDSVTDGTAVYDIGGGIQSAEAGPAGRPDGRSGATGGMGTEGNDRGASDGARAAQGSAESREAPNQEAPNQEAPGRKPPADLERAQPGSPEGGRQAGGRRGRGNAFGGDFDPTKMTEEQEQRVREMMKQRGLSAEQIDERIRQMKSGNMPRRPQRPPGSSGSGSSGSPPGSLGSSEK